LFALHPLHVESVAWVAERKDVLSGFFFIVTLAAYLGYVQRPSLWRYALTAGLLFLGLAAKPMLVTLPCVLLLLDYWPLNRLQAEHASPAEIRRRVRRLVIEKLPLFGVVAASCVITFLAQWNGKSVGGLEALPLTARLANAGIAYAKYVGKTFWPTDLAAFYPNYGFAPADDPHYWAFLAVGFAALVALAAITIFVLWFGRRLRYLTVGWLWFLGTLVPVIGLVQVGTQGMADRYTYLPLIGLFVMTVWGLPDLLRRFPFRRLALDAATVATVIACISLTWVQVGYWKNGLTLFSHAWKVNPHPRVRQLFAVSLARAGRHEEAITHYQVLTETRPYEPSPHHLLAASLFLLNRYDEALVHFRRSVELGGDDAVVRYNFGNLLSAMGDLDGAVAQYRASLEILRLPRAHNNLGTVLLRQRKYAEAAEQFEAALEISPTYEGARHNLDSLRAEHPTSGDKLAVLKTP
jgi:tetratricopeptide (TPR) repeat protein